MVNTCSLRDLPGKEGQRIIVTRFYPRGMRKEVSFDDWMPELAPSKELLEKWQNHQVNEEEFTKQFKKEVLGSPEAIFKMYKIHQMCFNDNPDKQHEVWLACHEPDGEFCHRNILKELILIIKQLLPMGVKCPYYTINSITHECIIKLRKPPYIHIPTRSGGRRSSKQTIYFRRVEGHPESCDFIPLVDDYNAIPEPDALKECVLFSDHTKIFTCQTCFYKLDLPLSSKFCLKKNCYVPKNSYCDEYIEQNLKVGKLTSIVRLKHMLTKGWTVPQIRESWISHREVGKREISEAEVIQYLKQHPELNIALPEVV